MAVIAVTVEKGALVILSEAKDLTRLISIPRLRQRELRYVVRQLHVYILASISRVLYVGVTNDLWYRVHEHRTSKVGFTAAYRVHRLVYFETLGPPRAAIAREKQLKRWTRKKKVALIQGTNPKWMDLAKSWYDAGAVPPSRHPERSEGSRPPDRPRRSGRR